MKIWIKYLIGVILGITIAFLFPQDSELANGIISFLQDIAIKAGKYSLFPFLFFTLILGTYKLKESGSLFKVAFFSSVFIIAISFLCSMFALLSVFLFSSPRVPIFQEEGALNATLGIRDAFLRIFPPNAFLAFSEDLFLLPICIFAAFIGTSCAVDKLNSRPLLQLFDSLSRLFYSIMAFFVDMLSIALIAISAYWMLSFRQLLLNKAFIRFITLLFIDGALVVLVIYPIILKICCPKINPYKIIYASIAPMMAAFFSGDANLALNVLFRHANESLGVRRRMTSFVLPLLSSFARAGSAMVITISFLVVMTSYSSLGMNNFKDMMYIVLISVFLSFCISHCAKEGVYIAISAVCALYGNGFESGFLILHPAIFFIASIGTAIDAVTSIVGVYIISYHSQMTNTRELRFFI
ncbi:MAG: dicarboxylate/amino acid:cation symporter [Treponema sp.]